MIRVHTVAAILVLASALPPSNLCAKVRGGVPHLAAAPAFIEVRLDPHVSLQRLKPGDMLRGKIARNVFFGEWLIVPKGSRISLTVSRLERRRRGRSVFLPWPIDYLRRKYVTFPAFDFANVTLPDHSRVRLPVSNVSAIDEVSASGQAQSKEDSGGPSASGSYFELVVDLKFSKMPKISFPVARETASTRLSQSEVQTIVAGTEARLALLGTLSTSRDHAGESFKALLIEPLLLKSDLMLPEGTIFEGRISKRTPARWLNRAGSLRLSFTRLTLPTGKSLPIAASLAAVGVGRRSPMKLSPEGGLSGGSPGKARLLIELGVSAGISKVADDTYQLVMEALVATASDASTAGTARLIGFGFSGLYWLTRRGRDVTLPAYTTFTIRFDRPPSLPPAGLAP